MALIPHWRTRGRQRISSKVSETQNLISIHNRDEREYVFSKFSSTGGIQRFEAGHHGSNHVLGAMTGYISRTRAMIGMAGVSE